MNEEEHNCDNVNCNHNDTKGLCCLYNPDNCKYRQLQKENAELKEQLRLSDLENHYCLSWCSKLTKAIKHLKDLVYVVELGKNELATARIVAEAKEFLKETK